MMFWNRSGRLAASLLLAVVVASCDHVETPTEVRDSQQPQELLGLLDPVLETTTTVKAADANGSIRTYTLIREPVLNLDLGHLRVSEVIGVGGGAVEILGHRIVVPAGAVDIPTLFTLIALPTGYVQVDITALAGDLLGGLSDQGSDGFNKPVRLDLTYSRATNVSNPRKLVILRLNPDGMSAVHEALPSTVDRSNERVTVWLDHFSGYSMAM